MMIMRHFVLSTAFAFFFLSFFISSSFAYLPIDANVSITLGATNPSTISCRNSSLTDVRCIVFGDGAGGTNYAWEFNYSGVKTTRTININNTFYGSTVVNDTFAIVQMNAYCDWINITAGSNYAQLGSDATCGYYDIGYMYPAQYYDGAYYMADGRYTGYPASWGLIESAPWNSGNRTIMLPNVSTNATIYTTGVWPANKPIMKWVNGAYSKTIGSIQTMWGIGLRANSRVFGGLWKNGTTTWMFIIDYCSAAACGSEKSYFYRVNFTKADDAGLGSEFTESDTYPTNSTIYDTSVQFKITLTAACNGTITWYLDNAAIGTTPVNTAPITDQVYYFASGVLTNGTHTWEANFTDDCGGATWSTGKITFTKATTSAVTTVAQNIANALGITLDNGLLFLGLLIAVTISGALAYYVKWQLFIPSMIVSMMALAVIGWFPAWVTVVMIVIAGMIFAKYGGFI